MHIHSSVYGHFSFCIFVFFITIVILNYCLFSSLLVFLITLIICSLCVQTHLAIKLFLILILILNLDVAAWRDTTIVASDVDMVLE